MRARDFFSQAQLRLQAAGCRYRIKRVRRSPCVQVVETHPPRRQQFARGYRIEDEEACWSLVEVLLRADEQALAGSEGLDWDGLGSCDPLGLQGPLAMEWEELRAPAPRHIPHTEDLQSWLDWLVEMDPLRGWEMAMIATRRLSGKKSARGAAFKTSLILLPWGH